MSNNKIIKTEEKRMEPIRGRLFIIPRKRDRVKDYFHSEDLIDTYPGLGMDDEIESIWVSDVPEDGNYGRENLGKGESNWSCHREHDHYKEFGFNGLAKGIFIDKIPAKWLENKKEGDILEITIYDDKFVDVLAQYELVCQQGKSRYESFGKFEEVYAR